MKSRFKGIIFDIDGTLTSTNQLIFDSFNFIAEKYLNKIFSDNEIISLFGPTEDVILKELCKENFKPAQKEYYEYYRNHHNIAGLHEGIIELLKDLKKQKVLLSIFTGKGRQASIITLEELGIISYFDFIVTGDEVKEHKPSPEGINLFLYNFNLKPNEVLMVGDSPSDIKAAKSAGVEIASVVWDSYSKEEVKKLNGEKIFHSVTELRSLIFKS